MVLCDVRYPNANKVTKDTDQGKYFHICFIGSKITFQLLYVYMHIWHTNTPSNYFIWHLGLQGFIFKT